MIVDAATYLGPYPFRDVTGAPAGLTRMMREHAVAVSIASPLDGLFHQDPEAANQRLMRAIKGRGSIFAAPIVNVRLADWRSRIELMGRDPQVRAIRIAPAFHGYPAAETRHAAECAAECDLAVTVQLRMADERFHPSFLDLPATPLPDIIALAAETPNVRWVASAARMAEIQQSAPQIEPLHNLWLDTSHIDGLDCIQRASAAVGIERLLFSTCWPFFYAKSAFLKIGEAGLSSEQSSRLLGGNAAAAFRLLQRAV